MRRDDDNGPPPHHSVTDSISSMDKLEIEGRTYKHVTVLPFLLRETASIDAAFLPNKAWGTSGRYEGILRGSQGRGDCIGDARSAWRGCWRFGLQRTQGRTAQGCPCSPCRSFPGIIKYFLRPGRRCNHIWICDSRALACWLQVGNPRSSTLSAMRI